MTRDDSLAVILIAAEARALFDLIDQWSGGNCEGAFAGNGTDDPNNPTTSACAKLYRAAGHGDLVPEDLLPGGHRP